MCVDIWHLTRSWVPRDDCANGWKLCNSNSISGKISIFKISRFVFVRLDLRENSKTQNKKFRLISILGFKKQVAQLSDFQVKCFNGNKFKYVLRVDVRWTPVFNYIQKNRKCCSSSFGVLFYFSRHTHTHIGEQGMAGKGWSSFRSRWKRSHAMCSSLSVCDVGFFVRSVD